MVSKWVGWTFRRLVTVYRLPSLSLPIPPMAEYLCARRAARRYPQWSIVGINIGVTYSAPWNVKLAMERQTRSRIPALVGRRAAEWSLGRNMTRQTLPPPARFTAGACLGGGARETHGPSGAFGLHPYKLGFAKPGRGRRRLAAIWAIAGLLMVSLAPGRAGYPLAAAPLRELHFSPDGRYVLAQDDAEITVLAVRPFAVLFRIPAQDATDAQFTPDSREVVFVRSVAHVERWERRRSHARGPGGSPSAELRKGAVVSRRPDAGVR